MSDKVTTEKSKEVKSEATQNLQAENLPELQLSTQRPGIAPTGSSDMHPDDNFDWSVNNEDVLLAEQKTTAVYVNRWGQAVIRQERSWDEESDPFMTIDHAHLPVVIERLQEIAAAPLSRDEPEPGKATGGVR